MPMQVAACRLSAPIGSTLVPVLVLQSSNQVDSRPRCHIDAWQQDGSLSIAISHYINVKRCQSPPFSLSTDKELLPSFFISRLQAPTASHPLLLQPPHFPIVISHCFAMSAPATPHSPMNVMSFPQAHVQASISQEFPPAI